MDLSKDDSQLILEGKDHSKRELLLVLDANAMWKDKTAKIISRQLSDFNIRVIRYVPEPTGSSTTGLVSVGRESIRFWKLKANGNMTATSITLDKSGRDKIFNDFAF